MSFKNKKIPYISVCVPVYNTEQVLQRCLQSVKNQTLLLQNNDFSNLELIIVNDASTKTDQKGFNAKKIVKEFTKNSKNHKNLFIKYIEHSKNKGLTEARRTAIYAAKCSKYIFVLDSDDFLVPDALKIMVDSAIKNNEPDIVHAKANVCLDIQKLQQEYPDHIFKDEDLEKFKKNHKGHCENVYIGRLENSKDSKDLFEGAFTTRNHTSHLWPKLIDKEIYLEALNFIPPVWCTLGEETLQYFFISHQAKSYVGIEDKIYNYDITSGITSIKKITSIENWKKTASAASIFTVIFSFLQENPDFYISPKANECLKILCRSFLENNIKQLKMMVSKEIQDEARQILYDYWGENLVKSTEENLEKNQNN